MGIEDDIAFLETIPGLNALGREALRIIAIGAESLYVHTGNVLFREGEPADAAFVVQSGSFNAETARDAKAGGGDVVGAGTLLGELALIIDTKRPVTLTALEPSSVLRIPRSLFLKMLEGYPQAALRMRDHIARRAEETEREIHAVRAMISDQ